MKVPEKSKTKKQNTKKKVIDKNKKEQVLVVAQEFKFARLLSGNEKKTRDRVLKALKKWLQNCFDKGYEFKEDDFVRVWKGLFYAVWMSDKPLVQEDLCESIAEILDLFPLDQLNYAMMMTKAGLKVLATEWYGIDQHRMDKFLMLVRRYLRGSLRCLQRSSWSLQSCQAYTKMLMGSDGILCLKTPQYARNAMSMILHFIDCFLEELAKVSKGEISEESVATLLRPFTSLVCGGEALTLCVASRRLLTSLLRQSEQGLQYQEATRAWQKMGCPAGGPEALELVSDDEEETQPAGEDATEEQVSALDPRAGRVDVLLPLLPVPARLLADQLRGGMAHASSKAYKRAAICLQRFEALSKDEYPLVVQEVDMAGSESPIVEAPHVAAQKLKTLEKTLMAQSDELALRGLKRKHRKRLLAKSRAGLSIVEDVVQLTGKQTTTMVGSWHVEDTQPEDDENKKINKSSKEGNEVIKKKANRKRKAHENDQGKVKKTKNLDNSVLNNDKVNKNSTVNNKIKVIDNSKVKDKNDDSAKVNGVNKESSESKVHSSNRIKDKIKGHKAKDKDTGVNKKTNLVNGHVKKAKDKKVEKMKLTQNVKNAPKFIEIDTQKSHKNSCKAESKKEDSNNTGIDNVKKNSKDNIDNNKKSKENINSKTIADANDKESIANSKINTNQGTNRNKHPAVANSDDKSNKRQKVLPMNKIKNYQKKLSPKNEMKSDKGGRDAKKKILDTPKKVKFVLKNNSMQRTVDYYKSIKQSPSIPFDSSKKPTKTNLKISTPSPINPFFKKKMKMKL